MDSYVVLECAISLAALAYVWFWQFGRLRRDNFRSDIRRLRDGLFDFIWENGYSYDMPAYQEIRQSLNGMLRLSNVLSPVKFFIAYLCVRHRHWTEALRDSLDHVRDKRLRDKIREVRNGALKRMLEFLFLEGTTGLLVRCIARLIDLKKRALRMGEYLLANAYELGSPTLSIEQRAVLRA